MATEAELELIREHWRKTIRVRDFLPPDFPEIVTLCGSTRFGDAYAKAMKDETLAGRIVLTVGLLGHAEGIDMNGPVKAGLDELHLRKIDLADAVLILNCPWWRCKACKVFAPAGPNPRPACGCEPRFGRGEWAPYVGESTRREVAYAISRGKKIRYLEPLED